MLVDDIAEPGRLRRQCLDTVGDCQPGRERRGCRRAQLILRADAQDIASILDVSDRFAGQAAGEQRAVVAFVDPGWSERHAPADRAVVEVADGVERRREAGESARGGEPVEAGADTGQRGVALAPRFE